MKRSCCRVFISYRRQSNSDFARLIRDALLHRGYARKEVFLDVDSMPGGHFPSILLERIKQAADVVVVISEGSLDRCRDKDDWLRTEVANAIKLQKNIVPVTKPDFQWSAQPLPEDMADLPRYQGVESPHELFEASMDRLVMLLKTRPQRCTARTCMAGVGAAATLLALAVAAYISWFDKHRQTPEPAPPVAGSALHPTTALTGERNPLALHWYGFGQRRESNTWREFQVHDGITMYDGDQFRIDFVPTEDCYVYVISCNADGSTSQLFPNPAIEQGAFCRGNQKYQIPDGINWFTLDEKQGTETIYLVAGYDEPSDLTTLVQRAGGTAPPANASQAVEEQIALVERQNVASMDGAIRTRSGVVVRNVEISPGRQVAQAQLKSNERIEHVMEFVQGKASVVQRIRFIHTHRAAAPD